MKKNILIFLAGMIFMAAVGFACIKTPFMQKVKNALIKARERTEERKFDNRIKAKGKLIISDFEDKGDFDKWQTINATLIQSDRHPSSDSFSAKIDFLPGKTSAIKVEKYFQNNRLASNWTPYNSLSLDIFNPQERKTKIILQIKDKNGKRFKKNISLNALSSSKIEIETSELRRSLDISNIGQLNIFLWEPAKNNIFYLDNVRLEPLAKKELESIINLAMDAHPYVTGDYFDFAHLKNKWLKVDSDTGKNYIEIPIDITIEASASFKGLVVSGGIPFPKSELKSIENLRLIDNTGRQIPHQAQVLSRWDDSSIKWLLLSFKADIAAKGIQNYFLAYADFFKNNSPNENLDNLKIDDSDDEICVITGPLKFIINKKAFRLFDAVWLDTDNNGEFDNDELISKNQDLALKFRGDIYRSSNNKDCRVSVEKKGPLSSIIRAEGWFENDKKQKFCKYVVRIEAYANQSIVKVEHTFIYTGYPENKFHYAYKGISLPKNETIESIFVEIPYEAENNKMFTFGTDNHKIFSGKAESQIKLLQDNYNHYRIDAENKIIGQGEKLSGWLDLSNDKNGIAVIVKNLWQQYPKKIQVDEKGLLAVYLWPQEAGELNLRTTEKAEGPEAAARGSAFGLAKTHELLLYFHNGAYKTAQVEDLAELFGKPPLLTASSGWISDTRVIGALQPYDPQRFAAVENMLEKIFDWAQRQIDAFRWYGMIDFGDTLSWYRKEAYDKSYGDWGWHPEGRHGWFNCEAAGTHTGALIQYLRTGKSKYFSFGENLARHIMDIDTCHYNTVAEDKRLKGKISDEFSQVGSMHRHNGDHWGGRNEEAAHTNALGILLYYYMTGDMRAFDVVNEIGSFFLKDPITYTGHPDIAPQRSIANVLWGDVLLYELTGKEKYKQKADKWADFFYQGQSSSGAWTENYNPVLKKWEGRPHAAYMLGYTLPALIEYHKLTKNKAIADCIVKGTDYLIQNEKYAAFFDALAYSYYLTGDRRFIEETKSRLNETIKHQRKSADPIEDGMIYEKLYYQRPNEFLYKTPFALSILTETEDKK